MDARVQAIRQHPKVGRGSCTVVDECWTDKEVQAQLDLEEVTTEEGAVEWAMDLVGLHLEQALNCRWGEEDDPEVKAYHDFMD